MKFFNNLLKSFHYDNMNDFLTSLMPTSKYNITILVSSFSALMVSIDKMVSVVFGLTGMAFISLVLILITELLSGLMASSVRKEAFESAKLRRFSFRLFYYLVLLSVPYLLSENYRIRGNFVAHLAFDWLHVFLVIQIGFENIISVLENIAVIEGKDKSHIIRKIKNRLKTPF